MPLSLTNGTHEVAIFKGGRKFDRTTDPYFFNSIDSVEAKVRAGNIAEVKVVVTPSYDDGIRILNSGLLGMGMSRQGQLPEPVNESAGSKSVGSKPLSSTVSATQATTEQGKSPLLTSVLPVLSVQFKYPGETDNDGGAAETPFYTGMLVAPDIDINDASISITLYARDAIGYLGEIHGVFRFEGEKAIDVLKDLASPLDLEITFDEGDTETPSILNKEISGAYNEPRLQTITNILFCLDCFYTTVSGDSKQPKNQLRVKSRKVITEDKVDFTFVQMRRPDVANNVFPIFNLSVRSNKQLFLPNGAAGSFQRYTDEKAKMIETKAVNPSDIDGKSMTSTNVGGGTLIKAEPTAAGAAPGLTNDADPELSGTTTLVIKRSDADNFAEVESSTKRSAFYMTPYNLTLPGIPRLRAMRLAQVLIGANVAGLSGVGWVEEVTHISDSNGWSSQVVFRQTSGAADAGAVANREVEDAPRASAGVAKTSSGFS